MGDQARTSTAASLRDQARTSTAASLRDQARTSTAASLRDLDRSALLAVALEALAVGGDAVDAPFASALASRDETLRRAAALFSNLAPELVAIVLSFVGARDVLRCEVAGAPLREAASEARLWAGLLRATWPREGAALCSLGNERLTFRVFYTKRRGERFRRRRGSRRVHLIGRRDVPIGRRDVPDDTVDAALRELARQLST